MKRVCFAAKRNDYHDRNQSHSASDRKIEFTGEGASALKINTMTAASHTVREPWRRRLYLPNYQIREAAKYADISAQTVRAWHKGPKAGLSNSKRRALSEKTAGSALSYLQLVEVAVVAALRKEKLPFSRIRDAREYMCNHLKSEYPFAEYRFKTNGKELWVDYAQVEGLSGGDKLLAVNREGQLAWKEMIDRRLKEFEYEDGGVAVKWHVGGLVSPVVIDPRVAYGSPQVCGIPTWIIKGRWDAGESINDIAEDFELPVAAIKGALKFEDIEAEANRKDLWKH